MPSRTTSPLPSGHLHVQVDDGLAHVRLSRPEKLNALTLAMLDDLAGAWGAALSPDAVITDVASTKSAIVVRASDLGLRFVGGHPMAAEHEGPARAAEEISQLLYHAQVMMIAAGISLEDVYSHL